MPDVREVTDRRRKHFDEREAKRAVNDRKYRGIGEGDGKRRRYDLAGSRHVTRTHEAADHAHNANVQPNHRDERKNIPVEYDGSCRTLGYSVRLEHEQEQIKRRHVQEAFQSGRKTEPPETAKDFQVEDKRTHYFECLPVFLTKIERDEEQERENRGNHGGNAGADNPELREAEFAECHRVAERYVDEQAEHVADHDHVRSADAGEIGRQAGLGQSHEHAGHQDEVVGTFQLDQCRIVLHGLENAGDEEDDQREEWRTHPGHDDALCDDFRALPGLARTEVLRGQGVGVGKKANEKTE